MGTDWRDNDPLVEPIVEIYQGMRQSCEIPEGPPTNSENDSIGGWRPKGFINLALEQGYKLGFESSSDHVSTLLSFANVAVEDFSREGILDALRKRHVYASTDNILADVRSGTHTFGDAFATGEVPELRLKLTGTQPFARVAVIKDNQYVYTAEPGTAEVEFRWRDNAPKAGKTSYHYVRGEQKDGEIVWVSPFWITYTGDGRRGVVSSDIGTFVAIHCAASLLASSLHTLVAPEHWARLSLMSRYWSGADAHAAGVWERIRRLVGAVALLA